MLLSFFRRLIAQFRATAGWTPELALRRFSRQQTRLQRDFFQRAASAGKPRGLRWTRCDWLPQRQLMRERSSGLLTLLVGINIQFEAIEGGDMEGVDALGMVRDACAVFHYQRGRWGTGGRALFNMHPENAAERLGDSYEVVHLTQPPAPADSHSKNTRFG